MTGTLAPAVGAFATRPVAEIADNRPGATAEVCCSGQAPLPEAVARRGRDALLGGPRLETDPAACVAFRPKAA